MLSIDPIPQNQIPPQAEPLAPQHNWKSIAAKIASFAIPILLCLAAIALVAIPIIFTDFSRIGIMGMLLQDSIAFLSSLFVGTWAEEIYCYFDRKAEELKTVPQQQPSPAPRPFSPFSGTPHTLDG